MTKTFSSFAFCVLQVWKWKQAAFTNVCSTFQSQKLTATEKVAAKLTEYPGYLEAGGAPPLWSLRCYQLLCRLDLHAVRMARRGVAKLVF